MPSPHPRDRRKNIVSDTRQHSAEHARTCSHLASPHWLCYGANSAPRNAGNRPFLIFGVFAATRTADSLTQFYSHSLPLETKRGESVQHVPCMGNVAMHAEQRTLLVAASCRTAASGACRYQHARGSNSGHPVSGTCPSMLACMLEWIGSCRSGRDRNLNIEY